MTQADPITPLGRRGPIIVIGDVMTDVVARVDDPLTLGSDTAAQVTTRQGGAGANTAAWLAWLSAPVSFVGRVGDDPFGREATATLAAGGVDVRVEVDPVLATGTVVVLVGADGERTMLPDAGANSALTAEDLPREEIEAAARLHLSGYTLLNPGSRAAGCAALALARSAGVPTSIDAASAAPLEALGGKEFLHLTEGVDLAFCTLDEAEVLTGTRQPETVLARLTGTYREVVIKLGASGARWASADGAVIDVPGVPASGPVVDTTGAGDSFAATYLAAVREHDDPEAALTRACEIGASVVTRIGARPPAQGASPPS